MQILEVEDGEVADGYDLSLEWPTDRVTAPAANHQSSIDYNRHEPDAISSSPRDIKLNEYPLLRLLVTRSSILPRKQKLVILPTYDLEGNPRPFKELHFGRDVASPGQAHTPRVRLKELEVSKLHATIYWDAGRRNWSIVDMGSKHGTFVAHLNVGEGPTSAQVGDHVDARGVRLSPPRMASMPRRLRHLDTLSIGGTSFVVHLHEDDNPCLDCHDDILGEVPLFTVASKGAKRGREDTAELQGTLGDGPRDAKKALTMLKRNLLDRHANGLPAPPSASASATTPTFQTAVYVDRSARRRALHPSSHTTVDAPGILNPRSKVYVQDLSAQYQTRTSITVSTPTPPPPSVESVSTPVVPLPATNMGHRLLMKQGWTPGTGLGADSTGMEASTENSETGNRGRVEPIQAIGNVRRAGLGMSSIDEVGIAQLVGQSGGDWKTRGREKRWDGVKDG